MTVSPISGAPSANAAAWGTQGTGYDPLTYFTAARTGQNGTGPAGQYEHMRLKMLPWVHRVVMGLVGDPNYPAYKSPDDVVRDALYHLIHLRQTQAGIMTPAMQDALDRFQQEQNIIDVREKLEHDKKTITDVQALAEEMVGLKMWESLHKLIQDQRDKSDGWEGDLRRTMMRLCNDYEAKIPKDIIF